MPPSGFNKAQASGIDDFLCECVSALGEEVKQKKLPYREAVKNEIDTIDRDLAKVKRSPASTSVLQLIRAFYAVMYERLTDTADEEEFMDAGYVIAENVFSEVVAIKVEEKEVAPA